jgi:hypothetical protein
MTLGYDIQKNVSLKSADISWKQLAFNFPVLRKFYRFLRIIAYQFILKKAWTQQQQQRYPILSHFIESFPVRMMVHLTKYAFRTLIQQLFATKPDSSCNLCT